MDGVDLVDHRTAAYHLEKKFSIRFYLRIVFDLMDVICTNSYIAYNMLHTDDLTRADGSAQTPSRVSVKLPSMCLLSCKRHR